MEVEELVEKKYNYLWLWYKQIKIIRYVFSFFFIKQYKTKLINKNNNYDYDKLDMFFFNDIKSNTWINISTRFIIMNYVYFLLNR